MRAQLIGNNNNSSGTRHLTGHHSQPPARARPRACPTAESRQTLAAAGPAGHWMPPPPRRRPRWQQRRPTRWCGWGPVPPRQAPPCQQPGRPRPAPALPAVPAGRRPTARRCRTCPSGVTAPQPAAGPLQRLRRQTRLAGSRGCKWASRASMHQCNILAGDGGVLSKWEQCRLIRRAKEMQACRPCLSPPPAAGTHHRQPLCWNASSRPQQRARTPSRPPPAAAQRCSTPKAAPQARSCGPDATVRPAETSKSASAVGSAAWRRCALAPRPNIAPGRPASGEG